MRIILPIRYRQYYFTSWDAYPRTVKSGAGLRKVARYAEVCDQTAAEMQAALSEMED